MYHGIDKYENMDYNARFFSEKNFKNQLIYFKKNYNIVSLDDYFKNKNLSSNKLNIAITFDDGYKNNFKYALPILEKLKVPAIFYITGLNNTNDKIIWADLIDIATPFIKGEITFQGKIFNKNNKGIYADLRDYIRSIEIGGSTSFQELKQTIYSVCDIKLNKPEFLDYWELMNDEEIKASSKSKYVKIGSHGYYHNNLANINFEHALDEVVKSKNYLENLVQYEINSIGYPDGGYTEQLKVKALELGFNQQCAVSYKFESDKNDDFISNRIGLYPGTNVHILNMEIQNFCK